jgi:putative transposase
LNSIGPDGRWAYKWLKRFDEPGLEGLEDQPRTGRPPKVSEEKFVKIKRELSENAAGWKAKEVMNIIYKKTAVRYHEVHVYRLLHKWGFSRSSSYILACISAPFPSHRGKLRNVK